MFDLRAPIGWLFVVLGLILVGYGIVVPVSTQVSTTTINLNVIWGAAMLVFGLFMSWLAFSDRGKSSS
jgi:uncharacterized membrane protein HdeD (DUF308 family)